MASAGAISAMEPSSGQVRRGDDADDADGLDHGGGDGAQRRIVHGAIIFVGPAGKGEEALDRGGDFRGAVLAGLRLDAGGEFVAAVVEVFGEEIEDLRAAMGRGRAPAEGGAGRFDGVADILAVALADFADELAVGAEHGAGIAAIGPGLLAADIHLGGLVDAGGRRRADWPALAATGPWARAAGLRSFSQAGFR